MARPVGKGRPWLVWGRCCCLSLRTTTIILATTELIFILAVMVFTILARVKMKPFPLSSPQFVVTCVEMTIQLVMACVLIFAAARRHEGLAWAWVWVRGVCVLTEFLLGALSAFVMQFWQVGLVLLLFSLVALANMMLVRAFAYQLAEGDVDPEEALKPDIVAAT